MRPKAIIWFERALLAALAIDLANNLLSWDQIEARLWASGVEPSTAAVSILAVFPILIGLLFWYFIARRGSVVAKWVMTLFVAIGVIGFAVMLARSGDFAGEPTVWLAIVSEAMKVFAVTRLFTREAVGWFSASAQGSPAAD